MAEIKRRSIRILEEAKPLQVSVNPLGGDPLTQVYDEETGDSNPDRTLLPLTLAPSVTRDGQDASASISSQGWYMIDSSGAETQITTATAGHTLVTNVTPMRLKISVNTAPNVPSKYVYRCKAGRESGLATATLFTSVKSRPNPTLEIDAASSIAWNPYDPAAADVMTITPTVQARGWTGLQIRWRKNDNGTLRAIDPTDPKDIECSFDGDKIKVNRRWMGSGVSLVCELLNNGAVADVRSVVMTRRIPDYDVEMAGLPVYSSTDTKAYMEADMTIRPATKVADPSQELRITWYDGTAAVGEGNSHTYSVAGKTSVNAGMGVEDRGPWCLSTDNGVYVTDPADGKYLLIRKND